MSQQRISRRRFLHLVGRAGGATAVYSAMDGLGLFGGTAEPYTGPPRLEGPAGQGQRIVILGAGLAGLTAAYELGKAGYQCVVLEARERAGGRSWTVRAGDDLTELGGERQECRFDPGLYLNAGASRIPQHHHALLDYCRQFGVPLEPFNNLNRAAYFYLQEAPGSLANQRLLNRALVYDMQGYAAELLAKAVSQQALDDVLSSQDAERLLDYLRAFGELDSDFHYRDGTRHGYAVPPDARFQPGTPSPPQPLSALLESRFWRRLAGGPPDTFEQQAVMLHPVGGMDRIAAAFVERLGPIVRYGAEVREIRQTPSGVRIVYHNRAGGEAQELYGNYCICTIPLPLLKGIPADLSPAMSAAIASVPYTRVARIGLQMARRFWEEDDGIYGGVTLTDQPIRQIHYPSTGYQGKKGILVGAYAIFDEALGQLSPAERIAAAREQGQRIHPQYATEFENGFAVSWEHVPFSAGGWAIYSPEARRGSYVTLNEPDGFLYLAGEHLSYLTAWQEGAVRSAQLVCSALHARVSQTA